MKNLYFKNWKYAIALCWVMLWTVSAYSTDNLIVSGSVTTTGSTVYSGIIGTYTYAGKHLDAGSTTISHDYWSRTSGGYTYYFYFNAGSYNDWEIFTALDDADYLCFGSNTTDPTICSSWTLNTAHYTNGSISVRFETATPEPEIDIKGNASSISDGNLYPSFSSHTKFVSTDISSGTNTRTYTILNTGTAALTITSVTITGTNLDQFSKTNPLSMTVAAGSSTTFTVTFDPSSVGTKTATITITNNDTSEGTYEFAIDGYGYSPENLVVTGITTPAAANTTYIHQGVLNNYEYWLSSNGYYLYIDGSNWFIDNNTVSTIADGVDFFSNCSFMPSILDASNWNGSPASGTRGTGTPVISAAAPTANINVKGNSTSIAINDATPSFSDYTKYGSVNISSGSRARTYTIENTGGAALTISGVTKGGIDAADFSVTTSPATSVAAYSSTTFTVTFDPTTEGTKTATISIASNDPDENPYLFYISGDAYFQNNLVVSGITGTYIAANGTYLYQGILNEFQYWKHSTQNYYVYNSVYSNQHYWYIDTDQSSTALSDFLFTTPSEYVTPVGLSSWSLGTGATGAPTIVYASPEMDVKGNSTSIVDGDATPSTADYTDFGSVSAASGTISRTFTIYNTGYGALSLSGSPKVAISGTNAAEFTVTTQPTSPVAATNGTTTFTVQFDPSATGTRSATISISNNDTDENPYNFSIQGTGYTTPTVTNVTVSSASTSTATLNGNITSDGSSNVTERGVVYSLSSINTNPQIGGTGVTKVAYSTGGTGSFSQPISSLSQGTSYHYNAYATNSAGTSYGTVSSFTTLTNGTFTGATNTDWATAANWAGGSVPTSSTDVTIPSGKNPVISATTQASCNNLTVTGSLTIASTSSGTGSLIVSGTSTGSVTCKRYMTNGKWHLISPITSGQTVAAFLTANTNIPTSGSTRGMMDYNTLGNSWNPYYPTSSPLGTMDAGKGYAARIATSDGTITFTGTLTTGTKTVALTTTAQGWNCVGNPYTSSINMNTTAHATNNFITVNSSNLDASYACVYVWDEDATYTGQNFYKIISNTDFSLPSGKTRLSMDYIASGQGFFVKAKTGTSNISFTSVMQSSQVNTAFRAPAISTSWPGIALNVASADASSSSAIIAFNENMTKGLDPTYDAGLLRGTNGLSLYTRLLEDNGVDFAVQCLPENYSNLVIPLGVDCRDGGEITFSAETVYLPTDCNVILEDRSTKTFTSLASGAIYKTSVSAGSTAVGRFYIRTAADFTTGTSGLTAGISCLKAYTINGTIIIEGEVSDQAIATLYDLQGLKVLVHQLQKGTFNTLLCPELMNGVYLLTIQQNGETMTRKLIMK